MSELSHSRFKYLNGAVQPFPVGRSQELKLDTDFPCAAPADNGTFDQDGAVALSEMDDEIHLHACKGLKRGFDPTTFA